MFKLNFIIIVFIGKFLVEFKLIIKIYVVSLVEVFICFIVCKVLNNSMNNLNFIIYL